MPLTPFQISKAIVYMGNIIRTGNMSERYVIIKAMDKLGIAAADRSAVKRAYDKAVSISEAANNLRRPHNRTPLASEIPSVRGDSDKKGKYRYEVLHTITNSITGEKTYGRFFYYTDVPTSLQNVRRQIDDAGYLIKGATETPQPGKPNPSDLQHTITVLSVGKMR